MRDLLHAVAAVDMVWTALPVQPVRPGHLGPAKPQCARLVVGWGTGWNCFPVDRFSFESEKSNGSEKGQTSRGNPGSEKEVEM